MPHHHHHGGGGWRSGGQWRGAWAPTPIWYDPWPRTEVVFTEPLPTAPAIPPPKSLVETYAPGIAIAAILYLLLK